MKDPFQKYTGGTYASHIYHQIKSMLIGERKAIDIADKSITEFRTALAYVCKKYELSFKTKTDEDDCLWVQRIK